MHSELLTYSIEGHDFEGYLAYDDSTNSVRPLVLIAHAWAGRDEFVCEKADRLAELGYVGFAMDVYGKGKLGTTNEENAALMTPLIENRQMLQHRLLAAMTTATAHTLVDANRVAAIGFCFGGLCVLDMARADAKLKGVVSFHGLLSKPENLATKSIASKVLVLHGHDDPMVPPEQVAAFENEMDEANADWQVHIYGHTSHAFSNPRANDPSLGLKYNPSANQRAWTSMQNFLNEIF